MLCQQPHDGSATCRPGNLKAAFEKHLEKGVKAPEVPTRTVELLPFPPDPTDPQPPPVTHVLRTVLFVDCIGDIPLRVHGVPVSQNQSMSSIKEALWRQVQPGQVRHASMWGSSCRAADAVLALSKPSARCAGARMRRGAHHGKSHGEPYHVTIPRQPEHRVPGRDAHVQRRGPCGAEQHLRPLHELRQPPHGVLARARRAQRPRHRRGRRLQRRALRVRLVVRGHRLHLALP